MDLKKGKYKKTEVQELLTEQSFKYEYEIVELRKEIIKLYSELRKAKDEILEFKKQKKESTLKKDAPSVVVLNKTKAKKNSGKKEFNPESKIKDYIKGKLGNGIDLEEAISVDDSQLGDICKDLGLTDEN